MAKKILVLGEIRDGSLRNVSYEAISAAKLLADGGEIVALLIGADAQSVAQNMIQYGANRVAEVSHNLSHKQECFVRFLPELKKCVFTPF